jgi:threonine dehydrogenase-like Zn-dependent dehydrogenase
MAEAPLLPKTMRAVVLRNSQHVEVMSVPTPHIRHGTDAIIKLHRTGLCG